MSFRVHCQISRELCRRSLRGDALVRFTQKSSTSVGIFVDIFVYTPLCIFVCTFVREESSWVKFRISCALCFSVLTGPLDEGTKDNDRPEVCGGFQDDQDIPLVCQQMFLRIYMYHVSPTYYVILLAFNFRDVRITLRRQKLILPDPPNWQDITIRKSLKSPLRIADGAKN